MAVAVDVAVVVLVEVTMSSCWVTDSVKVDVLVAVALVVGVVTKQSQACVSSGIGTFCIHGGMVTALPICLCSGERSPIDPCSSRATVLAIISSLLIGPGGGLVVEIIQEIDVVVEVIVMVEKIVAGVGVTVVTGVLVV